MFNIFKKKVEEDPNIVKVPRQIIKNVLIEEYVDNLKDPNLFDKQWVVCPDGTLGVIDHTKPDGQNLGIRPVNLETLTYYPNKSQHWSEEQKAHVPHEIVVHRDLVRPAPKAAIPRRPS